ncbi:mitotic apparatus protein p62-like [Pocillopora verrucosa]|uniref:mitotic apparatus protein p62-like n=1 Tax=Pocillopora verrucosa TaxID=203993 RepID=UPI00334025CB
MQMKLLLISCFLLGAGRASYLAEKREAHEVEDLNDEDFETASDKFDEENDEELENEDEAFDELGDEENERDAKELEEMNDEDEETGEDEVSEDPRPVPRKSKKKYGYLYWKGKGYRKYRKKPKKSYRKGYRKYRVRKGYYLKKGKGYGYRYSYRYPYYPYGR